MATFQPGQIQSLKSQGYSDDQIQQLQQQQLSSTDWSSLGLGMSGAQQVQPTIGGAGAGGTPSPQQQLGQQEAAAGGTTGALTRMILNQQGGGQQTGQPPPANYYGTQYPLYAMDARGNPTGQPIYANPTNQASLLGAAALGMPAVINPPPSGTPSSKSGVAPTGGALVGTNVPRVDPNWDMIANQAGLSSHDVAGLIAQGMTPAQAAQKFNVPGGGLAGPWSNPQFGSVFTPVARTAPTMALGATPLQAAAQPTAIAYNPTATPFAQAPPAPGVQIPPSPLIAAHTDALANAGQALYAHFGGDPNSASPADIANFHSQLTSALGAPMLSQSSSPMANPLASGPPQPIPWQQAWAGQHGLTNPTPPVGGPSPLPWQGGPNPQTGVMPNFNPATLAAAPQPTAARKMQSGGFVQGFDDGGSVQDQNAPPEARRKTLSTPASGAPPSQTSSAPTAPTVPTGSGLATGIASAAHTYADTMHNWAGAGIRDIRNTPLDPDPDLPYLKAAGMAGGAGSGQPTANVLSGIGSGLTQAAQAIASSAKPWQMQQSAIPAPPPAAPVPQLTQPPAPQQAQQAVNPYAAYAANQARYPTSPYYT